MVIPGVMNFLHGYLQVQDVSLYIQPTIFALSIEEGGTYSELVCMGINILLYIFILMYVYKYINIYIYRYIFSYKNIVGLL